MHIKRSGGAYLARRERQQRLQLMSFAAGGLMVSVAAGLGDFPAIVRKGQKLGSVRALGIEWPVLAPAAGLVLAMLAEDASVVEYGQVLVDFAVAD